MGPQHVVHGSETRGNTASHHPSRQSGRRPLWCACISFTRISTVWLLFGKFTGLRRPRTKAMDLFTMDKEIERQPLIDIVEDSCIDAEVISDRVYVSAQERSAAGQHVQKALTSLHKEDQQTQSLARKSPYQDETVPNQPNDTDNSATASMTANLNLAHSTGQLLLATSPGRARHARSTSFTAAQYASDYRNGNHSLIPPQECFHNHCHIHYSDKVAMGWFLSERERREMRCDGPWFQCFSDICEAHLWDKRARRYFPGRDDPAEHLRMGARLKGECEQGQWQTCLQDDCFAHYVGKQLNGFVEPN